MAAFTRMVFCSALLAATAAATTAAEDASAPAPAAAAWRRQLDVEGSSQQQCWETLMQIKSCTGEIILFFLEGETYLGQGCCRAVRAIEQRCWAADAMLSVMGFTPKEGDMLKDYCHDEQQQQGEAPPPRGAADYREAAVTRVGIVGSFAGRKHGPLHGVNRVAPAPRPCCVE